jgi:hypothetical protein
MAASLKLDDISSMQLAIWIAMYSPTLLEAGDDWADESALDTIWLDGNEAIDIVSTDLIVDRYYPSIART